MKPNLSNTPDPTDPKFWDGSDFKYDAYCTAWEHWETNFIEELQAMSDPEGDDQYTLGYNAAIKEVQGQ